MDKVYFIKAEDGRLLETADTIERAEQSKKDYESRGMKVKIIESR